MNYFLYINTMGRWGWHCNESDNVLDLYDTFLNEHIKQKRSVEFENVEERESWIREHAVWLSDQLLYYFNWEDPIDYVGIAIQLCNDVEQKGTSLLAKFTNRPFEYVSTTFEGFNQTLKRALYNMLIKIIDDLPENCDEKRRACLTHDLSMFTQ